MKRETDVAGATEVAPSRWQIVRALVVFQFKLLIDAGKDFLLSPLSFIAALIDLFRPAPPSRMLFPEVLRMGRRAEHAINLFGRKTRGGSWTVDRWVDDVESGLRERYGDRNEGTGDPGDSPGPPDKGASGR